MAPNCCYSAIISAGIWPDAFRESIKFMFNNQTLSDVTFAVQASQSHNNETEPCSGPTIYIQAHKSFADDKEPSVFIMFCGKMAKAERNKIICQTVSIKAF